MIDRRTPTSQAIPPQRGPRLGHTLAFICGVPAPLAFLAVAAPEFATPVAASIEIAPQWRVRWEALSSDDRRPTPHDGSCDASFARRRLCMGPLELRYSYFR